jgi:hypothetical protein
MKRAVGNSRSGSYRKQFNCFELILLLAFFGNCFWGGGVSAQTQKQPDPGAAKAAREYLYALAKGDKATLTALTPQKLENYYGPSLFSRIPTLSKPRVKGHRALIDFDGQSSDPDLPKQGTIALVLKDSRTTDRWVVRGIFWQGSSSLTLNPFKYSETPTDRSQEPSVKACAFKYLQAWEANDGKILQYMTYDWLNKKKPLKGDAIIRSIALQSHGRPDGSVRVEFTAAVSPRFPIVNLFRKTARGHIYVIQEEGVWKVRGMLAGI